jgi:hypothetical protein
VTECRKLDETFPHFIRQMESMLTTGELSPQHAHCVTLYHNGFTCEADTLAVAATYTSPFTPLSVNYLHESKHENFTCNNSAGGEALPVTRGCLANVLTRLLEQHYGLTLNDTPFSENVLYRNISMPDHAG